MSLSPVHGVNLFQIMFGFSLEVTFIRIITDTTFSKLVFANETCVFCAAFGLF